MSWQAKQCVVVPIDFSESAVPAIREGLSMAKSPDCVHVVHVLADLDSVSPGVLFGNVTDDTRKTAAEKYTREFLSKHAIDGVNVSILVGDPGTRVVDFAKQKNADLIMVPSHGYHGVKHLLLGSVAERIIRYANCAVYVLRRHDAE